MKIWSYTVLDAYSSRANCNNNDSTVSTCALSNNERIGIYSGLVSSVWISCLLRSFLFYALSLRAARTLHNRMFSSVIRGPVLFFDTNPIGRYQVFSYPIAGSFERGIW